MNWDKLLSEKRIRKSSKKGINQTRSDIRNDFESDLGRIIYSPALRRMHDKTQVFPLTTDDNIHTRLTHSTEVMSLGYTFGLKCAKSKIIQARTGKSYEELLRIIPIILQSISFIHDIGNPPFGHYAEKIIANYFDDLPNNPLISEESKQAFNSLKQHQKNDFIHYDGNAQGFRVITKLQRLDDVFGLNLTYSILGSYLKYPNHYEKEISPSEVKYLKKKNICKSKHGVFYSEKEYFKKILDECGLKDKDNNPIRHPLCFLMEAADSIAYRVMDIEDGFSKGYVKIADIEKAFSENSSTVSDEIVDLCIKESINDETKMVFTRIKLIDYLVELAFKNFESNIENIEKGEYHKELIEDDANRIHEILADICIDNIFSTREINHLETTGYSVINGLLNHYINQLFHSKDHFVKRSITLISSSTINVALEEDMSNYIKTKYREIPNEDIQKNDDNDKSKYKSLNDKIDGYLDLVKASNNHTEIDYEKIKILRNEIFEGFKELKKEINFFDLSDYYKFRVIVDFISGMTDKYALSHFQKISGQKID